MNHVKICHILVKNFFAVYQIAQFSCQLRSFIDNVHILFNYIYRCWCPICVDMSVSQSVLH